VVSERARVEDRTPLRNSNGLSLSQKGAFLLVKLGRPPTTTAVMLACIREDCIPLQLCANFSVAAFAVEEPEKGIQKVKEHFTVVLSMGIAFLPPFRRYLIKEQTGIGYQFENGAAVVILKVKAHVEPCSVSPSTPIADVRVAPSLKNFNRAYTNMN